MLMLRRSKDQILTQILEICLQSGSRKTRIVYQANTNFNTANLYLDLLTRKKLLEVVPGKFPIYRTTLKGKRALERLRTIEEKIPERLL
jgi:predicted transcriptional regulator